MKYIGKTKALEMVKAGAFLVDMRNPVAFRDGHVEGAVNLPLRNFTNTISAMDKKRKIIIYGDTVADEDLKYGNTYAEVLGFADVFTTEYSTLTSVEVPEPAKKVTTHAQSKGRKRNTKR